MNETAILAKASAVGLTAPGKCPRCLTILDWLHGTDGGLIIACPSPTCDFAHWFTAADLLDLCLGDE